MKPSKSVDAYIDRIVLINSYYVVQCACVRACVCARARACVRLVMSAVIIKFKRISASCCERLNLKSACIFC